MPIYLASMMTGQSFRIYKDVEIKDLNFEGVEQEKVSGTMAMIEFTPTIPDEKLFFSDFWADFSEDIDNRTLTINLSTKGEIERSPYILSLNISAKSEFTFNITTSVFANSNESLKWYNILMKIKKLDYRRVYIKDYCGNDIFISACPEMNISPSPRLGEYFNQLAILENKSNNEFFPIFEIDDHSIKLLKSSVTRWDEMDTQEQTELVDRVNALLSSKTKSTLVTVSLKIKDKDIVPMMITHHLHWFNYKDFDINFKDKNERNSWNELVMSQGQFILNVKARTLYPFNFFTRMNEERQQGKMNHLSIIDDLLQHEEGVLPTIKTSLNVEFLSPMGNLQEIRITIEDADNDLNVMEEFLNQGNYIAAIPYLEKFSLHLENLAYAYTVNGDFDKGINLSNELIRSNLDTVAHMTKGLALVGKGEINKAYESYLLGVNVVTANWFPIALHNLEEFLVTNKIKVTEEISRILNILKLKRKPKNPSKRCYCGSSKSIRKCHGNLDRL